MPSHLDGIHCIRSTSPRHASTYEDHQLHAPQAMWDAGVPVLGNGHIHECFVALVRAKPRRSFR